MKNGTLRRSQSASKVEDRGLEPVSENDATGNVETVCGFCELFGAANALHSDRIDWLQVALSDANLSILIMRWSSLEPRIRELIKTLVNSQQ